MRPGKQTIGCSLGNLNGVLSEGGGWNEHQGGKREIRKVYSGLTPITRAKQNPNRNITPKAQSNQAEAKLPSFPPFFSGTILLTNESLCTRPWAGPQGDQRRSHLHDIPSQGRRKCGNYREGNELRGCPGEAGAEAAGDGSVGEAWFTGQREQSLGIAPPFPEWTDPSGSREGGIRLGLTPLSKVVFFFCKV